MDPQHQPRVVCVIPSRYAAQRLPGKPLVELCGKPLIQWVVEAARRIEGVDEVLVATDDERIARAVESTGTTAVITPPECPSGTDRIQVAIAQRKADIVVNLQGDEPLMQPEAVRRALTALIDTPRADVATACVAITDRESFEAPHIVKVVRGLDDRALYFSRAPVPSMARATPAADESGRVVYGYKHLGLYIYRREALEAFVRFDPTPLELQEKLEQLRFLELGATILCPEIEHDSIGVDTPEDIARVEAELRRRGMA